MKKILLLISTTLLYIGANAQILKSPLNTLPTDSVVLQDFFSCGIVDSAKNVDSTLAIKQIVVKKSDYKKFDKWNERLKNINLLGGIGDESTSEANEAMLTAEQCAKMLLMTGDAKYADHMERALYNGVFPSLFAQNDTKTKKMAASMLRNLSTYTYAENGRDIYLNLFVQSIAHICNDSLSVWIHQNNSSPWYMNTSIAFRFEGNSRMRLHIRKALWAKGESLVADAFTPKKNNVKVSLNGQKIKATEENGYIVIDRIWNDSDMIYIEQIVPTIRLKKPGLGNLYALQRGPLVYSMPDTINITTKTPLHVDFSLKKSCIELSAKDFYSIPYYRNVLNGIEPKIWGELE